MKSYVAAASLTLYDENAEESFTEYIILSEVSSYVDAVQRIEARYDMLLESMDITLLEGPFVEISAEYFEKFVQGEMGGEY